MSGYRYRLHVPSRSNAELYLAGVSANLDRFQDRQRARKSREAAQGDSAALAFYTQKMAGAVKCT